MIIELFIFFEIITVASFAASFFIKNEILWVLTIVLAGIMMFNSFAVEETYYIYNPTLFAYEPTVILNSYPYVAAINMLFFGLSLILGLFDILTKYGIKFGKHKEDSF